MYPSETHGFTTRCFDKVRAAIFFLLNASDNELAFVRKKISLRLRLSNVFPIAAPHTKLKIYYR